MIMINENHSSQVEIVIPVFVTEELNPTIVNSLATIKSTSENDVTVFLSGTMLDKSYPSNSSVHKFLDVICRKLSVHRMVRTSYDIQWQRAINETPLAVEWWPLMLFLLLGKHVSGSPNEDAYGITLKQINAAFVGIDVAQELKVARSKLLKLKNLAERQLCALTG